MKVSVITVVFNNHEHIQGNIDSVSNQSYKNIEHIIVDGKSTDSTLDIIKRNQKKISKWISEKDNGIYDAMNKGIELSTGDIIGFLNSDDIYFNDCVVENIVKEFKKSNPDSVYGDLVYTDEEVQQTIRYWKSGKYRENLMQRGWMPPHPTFYVKKEIFDKYGVFNLDYSLSADYELMLRLLNKEKIETSYIPNTFVRMRIGGKSNLVSNYLTKYKEDYKAMKSNNISFPIFCLINKNISKISQFFIHK